MAGADVVTFDAPKDPIRRSPGFAKKRLSEWKLDIMGLCSFGCKYCSSNSGNYLRINREKFADETERQLGRRLLPASAPGLTFEWEGVADRVRDQIRRKRGYWGEGETLVFSMLTDGFSPRLVTSGVTEDVLHELIDFTGFRIRILTKSAIVGMPRWVDLLQRWGDRVLVGLSIGTLDDRWAKKIEVGTSSPSARIRALHRLQDAGVPTYGMLCPVFPDVVQDERGVEQLVDAIRPGLCEEIFAEPYNDRANWRTVAEGYGDDSPGRLWLQECYGGRRPWMWSSYAVELYQRIRAQLKALGIGPEKLRYLLYELGARGDAGILEEHADALGDSAGILFQSKPGEDGLSQNPAIRSRQAAAGSSSSTLPASR